MSHEFLVWEGEMDKFFGKKDEEHTKGKNAKREKLWDAKICERK